MLLVVTLAVVAGALTLALGLAYIPMSLLVAQMAKNVRQFISRRRDRRHIARTTADRRKAQQAEARE